MPSPRHLVPRHLAPWLLLLSLTACQSLPQQTAPQPAPVATTATPAAIESTPSVTVRPSPASKPVAAPAPLRQAAPATTPPRTATLPVESRKPGVIYRHSDGIEMRYNKALGVYDVINMQGLYFHNGQYLRHDNRTWWVSQRFDGPWLAAGASQIPGTLLANRNR